VTVEIALATEQDIDVVSGLLTKLAVHDSELDDLMDPNYAESLQFRSHLAMMVQMDLSYVAVARVNDRAIGAGIGRLQRAEAAGIFAADLQMLYVEPDMRGHGVGRMLVGHFQEWAKGKGASMLKVTTYLNDNEATLGFYKALDMTPTMVELRKMI